MKLSEYHIQCTWYAKRRKRRKTEFIKRKKVFIVKAGTVEDAIAHIEQYNDITVINYKVSAIVYI